MNVGRERDAWEGREKESEGSQNLRERERERKVSLTERKGDVGFGDCRWELESTFSMHVKGVASATLTSVTSAPYRGESTRRRESVIHRLPIAR